MNLKELDSFKMSDAVVLHDALNPALFDGEHLRPDVRAKLLEIAEEFIDYLGVSNLDVKDITISGSNAAYSYTPHSDIDLHIIADLTKFNNDEVYRELFTAKKNLFNADHNIKIKGYDVELYVQDSKKPVRSLGEYSVERNKWIKFPSKQRANLDHHSVENKFKKLVQLGQLALRSTDMEALGDVLSTIKRYRQAGLDEHGEFGPENLAFKALRSQGIVDKLYNHMDALKSRQLSLDEENKKLLNKKTLTIDQIANKHNVNRQKIVDELVKGIKIEFEHTKSRDVAREIALDHLSETPDYYSMLATLRLETTLSEASGYIPSEKERNDPRFKTALTVDIHPDSIQQNAKKLGSKIARSGVPPTLKASGKL